MTTDTGIQSDKGLTHTQAHIAERVAQQRVGLTAHELTMLTVGSTGAQQHLARIALGVSQATKARSPKSRLKLSG